MDIFFAETNEKSIFRFWRCLVLEIWSFFYTKNWQFSINFQFKIDQNSNNKNLKYDFSFDSTLWASFMKFAPFLSGAGDWGSDTLSCENLCCCYCCGYDVDVNWNIETVISTGNNNYKTAYFCKRIWYDPFLTH